METFASQLLAAKTTKVRFRMPTTEEQTVDALTAAYKAEVMYRGKMFENDEQTKDNIKRVAKFLTSDSGKFGVMLCGVCGNGKTTLLYAFRNLINYFSERSYFEDKNTGLLVVDAKDVSFYAKDVNRFKYLKGYGMVAIDDVGREQTSVLDYGNVLNPLIDLFEYRYNNQLFTFITTNLKPEEIRKKYGDRIADRFNEMFGVISFKNSTYRK